MQLPSITGRHLFGSFSNDPANVYEKHSENLGKGRIVRRIFRVLSRLDTTAGAVVTLEQRSNLRERLDPVPNLLQSYRHDPDLFWMGWFLVTMNASDWRLRSQSVGLLTAIEAPSTLFARNLNVFWKA